MSLQLRSALGYGRSEVQYCSEHELAWVCGNALVLYNTSDNSQRLLRGSAYGIQCFTANRHHGLVVVAEKGPMPAVHIYDLADLRCIGTVTPDVSLGVSAIALSADATTLAVCMDEPDLKLALYNWQTVELLAQASVPNTVSQVSFHPLDAQRLATSSMGSLLVWTLARLWDKHALTAKVPECGGVEPACHAWFPGGLYVGGTGGQLLALDAATLVPLTLTPPAAHTAALPSPLPSPRAADDSASQQQQQQSEGGVDGSHAAPPPAPPLVVDACAGPVAALCVSRDAVCVAPASEPILRWYSHAVPGFGGRWSGAPPLALLSEVELPVASGLLSVSGGGPGHCCVAAGSADGAVLLATTSNMGHADGSAQQQQQQQQPPSVVVVTLAEAHVGPVAGLAPFPGVPHHVVSAGADGTLRVWHAPTGVVVSKRTFSSAQTALAVAASCPLAALGSETGVLRIVELTGTAGDTSAGRPLPVLFRKRLHPGAVSHVALSPDGEWAVSFSASDQQLVFVAFGHGGRGGRVLGSVPCHHVATSLMWPAAGGSGADGTGDGGDEPGVIATTAAGGVFAAAAPVELHASGRATTSPDFILATKDAPTRSMRLEVGAPPAAAACAPCAPGGAGSRYGDVLLACADRSLVRVPLPAESSHWAGFKGRPARAAARADDVSDAALAALALAPSRTLVASVGADGHVALHSAVSLDPAGSTITPWGSAPHDVSTGGASLVSFDASGEWLLTAGHDGSLLLFEAPHAARVGGVAACAALTPRGTGTADLDAFDEPSELTEADAHRRRCAEAAALAEGGTAMASFGGDPRVSGVGSDEDSAHAAAAVRAALMSLKDKLLDAMARNEAADELERIGAREFIVDRALMAELKTDADARVAALHTDIAREHLSLELVASRVKAACWDDMSSAKGAGVSGMRSGTGVRNFPMGPKDNTRLTKILTLRRIELAEHADTGGAALSQLFAPSLSSQPSDGASLLGTLGELPPTPGPAAATATAASSSGAAAAPGGASTLSTASSGPVLPRSKRADADGDLSLGPHDDISHMLYDCYSLRGTQRKVAQAEMLKHQAWQVRARFNQSFDALVTAKRNETDKIHDLNARLDETARDLTKLGYGDMPGCTERFSVPMPEDMHSMFKVTDDEVKVERMARAGDGAASKVDAGGGGGQQEAGMSERALRQMMGGTLASAADEKDPYIINKPEWMNGNPKLFNEEEAAKFKEWLAQEKAMSDERTKRVGVLESELRATRQLVDDVITKFDDGLAALLSKKLSAQSEVSTLEAGIAALAINLERCDASSDAKGAEWFSKFAVAGETKTAVSAELADKRAVLEELLAQMAEITADDKALNAGFKKEFSDVETHFARLLQLYRHRASAPAAAATSSSPPSTAAAINRTASVVSTSSNDRARAAAAATAAAASPAVASAVASASSSAAAATAHQLSALAELSSATADPFPLLPPELSHPQEAPDEAELLNDELCPEGLDAEWWYHLQEYRGRKVRNENAVRQIASQLAILTSDVSRLESAESDLIAELTAGMEKATERRRERTFALHDVDMTLGLKAGQVEVEPPSLVSSDMSAGVLVYRGVAEAINDAVRARGDKKTEVMTTIKDFKKGIYSLEWEHRRCDMMIGELVEKTRELQMLHVTRDFQSVFNDSHDVKTANEGGSLEALARQREAVHAKNVSERQKTMRKLAKAIEGKRTQNGEVAMHLVTLERVLAEQERLRSSMQSVEDAAGRKMRSVVTHKKLKDIAAAQASEVHALTGELDRLRKRTYPTFVESQQQVLPPDAKAGMWKQ
ncbi:hypothetical protein FOA52_011797 [Chlamydomonas sp. UWO 241]|nr:hypothetical protein FOA52_011797 [Chlamydomonas sp. UWO 241]